jgi:hypothetical protein
VCQEDLKDRLTGVLHSISTELRDVAHASDGDIDDMLQQEALRHNTEALGNARAVHQVVAQLRISETRLQQHLRNEYKLAEADWRQLRTKHVITTLVNSVRNTDCAQPKECDDLVDKIKLMQQQASLTVSLCITDDLLVPRHLLSAGAVQRCARLDCYSGMSFHSSCCKHRICKSTQELQLLHCHQDVWIRNRLPNAWLQACAFGSVMFFLFSNLQ